MHLAVWVFPVVVCPLKHQTVSTNSKFQSMSDKKKETKESENLCWYTGKFSEKLRHFLKESWGTESSQIFSHVLLRKSAPRWSSPHLSRRIVEAPALRKERRQLGVLRSAAPVPRAGVAPVVNPWGGEEVTRVVSRMVNLMVKNAWKVGQWDGYSYNDGYSYTDG